MSDSAVRIVGDDGGGPEEPNDAYKLPRWTRVFVPAAIAAVVVAAFFLAMSNPPWRPTASGVVVDVYLEIGTPETAEQMLNQVGTHASVVDRRLLRQPPRLQGWLTPSACDYRPIVRLMVPRWPKQQFCATSLPKPTPRDRTRKSPTSFQPSTETSTTR